ncbi:Uncharacterised protein [uncultured archaeon]|nr:Uncharacterised protein [uncultured archaeon]
MFLFQTQVSKKDSLPVNETNKALDSAKMDLKKATDALTKSNSTNQNERNEAINTLKELKAKYGVTSNQNLVAEIKKKMVVTLEEKEKYIQSANESTTLPPTMSVNQEEPGGSGPEEKTKKLLGAAGSGAASVVREFFEQNPNVTHGQVEDFFKSIGLKRQFDMVFNQLVRQIMLLIPTAFIGKGSDADKGTDMNSFVMQNYLDEAQKKGVSDAKDKDKEIVEKSK